MVHVDEAILLDTPAANDTEPHRCELDDGSALGIDTARASPKGIT